MDQIEFNNFIHSILINNSNEDITSANVYLNQNSNEEWFQQNLIILILDESQSSDLRMLCLAIMQRFCSSLAIESSEDLFPIFQSENIQIVNHAADVFGSKFFKPEEIHKLMELLNEIPYAQMAYLRASIKMAVYYQMIENQPLTVEYFGEDVVTHVAKVALSNEIPTDARVLAAAVFDQILDSLQNPYEDAGALIDEIFSLDLTDETAHIIAAVSRYVFFNDMREEEISQKALEHFLALSEIAPVDGKLGEMASYLANIVKDILYDGLCECDIQELAIAAIRLGCYTEAEMNDLMESFDSLYPELEQEADCSEVLSKRNCCLEVIFQITAYTDSLETLIGTLAELINSDEAIQDSVLSFLMMYRFSDIDFTEVFQPELNNEKAAGEFAVALAINGISIPDVEEWIDGDNNVLALYACTAVLANSTIYGSLTVPCFIKMCNLSSQFATATVVEFVVQIRQIIWNITPESLAENIEPITDSLILLTQNVTPHERGAYEISFIIDDIIRSKSLMPEIPRMLFDAIVGQLRNTQEDLCLLSPFMVNQTPESFPEAMEVREIIMHQIASGIDATNYQTLMNCSSYYLRGDDEEIADALIGSLQDPNISKIVFYDHLSYYIPLCLSSRGPMFLLILLRISENFGILGEFLILLGFIHELFEDFESLMRNSGINLSDVFNKCLPYVDLKIYYQNIMPLISLMMAIDFPIIFEGEQSNSQYIAILILNTIKEKFPSRGVFLNGSTESNTITSFYMKQISVFDMPIWEFIEQRTPNIIEDIPYYQVIRNSLIQFFASKRQKTCF